MKAQNLQLIMNPTSDLTQWDGKKISVAANLFWDLDYDRALRGVVSCERLVC